MNINNFGGKQAKGQNEHLFNRFIVIDLLRKK